MPDSCFATCGFSDGYFGIQELLPGQGRVVIFSVWDPGPGFTASLQETERWQVTMLLKHADKLPAGVQALLKQPPEASH